VNGIGNNGYIKTLARSFKVLPSQIYQGLWVYLKNDPRMILEAVALMIKANLQERQCNDPDFFFANILLPYFSYLANGYPIYTPIENSLFKQFNHAFKIREAEKSLRNFSCGFKRYLSGEPLSVDLKNSLNAILKIYGYRVYIGDRTCVGYRVLKNRIRINKKGVGEILFIKKVSVSLSVSYLGLSTLCENDVVLSVDDIMDEVSDMQMDLQNSLPLYSCSTMVGACWPEFNLGFSVSKADSILNKLLIREFSGMTNQQIFQKRVQAIAVHEAKHKWDEKAGPKVQWYNVDCETSAHLADAIFGGVSFFSLTSIIAEYQRFYKNTREQEVRVALNKLLGKYWAIAKAASENSIGSPQVIDKLNQSYKEYTMIEGGKLPDISAFKKDILGSFDTTLGAVTAESSQN
jgi:hypothetical protein